MSAHLGKIALMVAMSHGFRALGRFSGPRMAGLLLGLPCMTAVALVGGGADRGVDHAVAMSGSSLIGLIGAVALPMAFARAILWRWKLSLAILAGVASYLGVALAVGRLLPGRGEVGVGLALMAVLAAAWGASRIRVESVEQETPRPRLRGVTSTRLLRTVVPVGCLLASLGLGESCGPEVAGLMSTFPGVTLTVLWLTYLESGPASALKITRSLPAGNLGMVAFLAVFRFGSPSFGLAWATAAGYLGALLILALVIWIDGRHRAPSSETPRSAWPRASRRFSPLLEPCYS